MIGKFVNIVFVNMKLKYLFLILLVLNDFFIVYKWEIFGVINFK